jgi:superfamily II DNA or RNA helicase
VCYLLGAGCAGYRLLTRDTHVWNLMNGSQDPANPPNLEQLSLKTRYRRTSTADLMQTFLVPCLGQAVSYDRIAGYFSASTLCGAAHGFNRFVQRDGASYRLIVGASLIGDEHDVLADYDRACDPSEVEKALLKEVDRIAEEPIGRSAKDRLKNLTFMLDNNILELKVGILINPKSMEAVPHDVAEFHEKVGIVSDGKNCVSFIGSVNESMRGWSRNLESIDVFCDWRGDDPASRVRDHQADFDAFWKIQGVDAALGVAIYELPSSVVEKMKDKFPPTSPTEADVWEEPSEDSNKWRHQDEAVDWFCRGQAQQIGIMEMATGSGKTRTSMRCMRELLELSVIDRVVVAVPNSLLRQWRTELTEHLGMKGHGGAIALLLEHSGDLNQSIAFCNARGEGAFLLVSHTMLLKFLRRAKLILRDKLARTLVVVDELHNVGADRFTREELGLRDDEVPEEPIGDFRLFGEFGARLGLSATPWSDFDNERNAFLIGNFTRSEPLTAAALEANPSWKVALRDAGQVFHFGLEDGIRRGLLAEFDYVPLPYEPSAKDKIKYAEFIRKGFGGTGDEEPSPLGAIRAAAVFKASKEKIPVFTKWLDEDENDRLDRTIVFVQNNEFADALLPKLTKRGYQDFVKFFEGDPYSKLEKFAAGKTHFVIACQRISEGIDIRSVSQIILFSSASVRLETIQRVGRALRRGDSPKRATVVDFIFDNPSSTTNPDVARRDWLTQLATIRSEE